MKLRSILFGTLCALMLAGTFAACDSENNEAWSDNGSKVALPKHRAYILYEGSWKGNNAGIAFYAPNKDVENNFISDIYLSQNQKKLGDTAQDIIAHEGELFVTVSISRLLLKLNAACVEEGRLSFSETDGNPRYLAAKGGKIYVSLYSGRIARVDARTMTIDGYVEVGNNPEQLAEANGKLYAAITNLDGTGSSVAVVDIANFKKEKDITTMINPYSVLAVGNDVYLISQGNWTTPTMGVSYTLQRITPDGKIEQIGVAERFATHKGVLYINYRYTQENAEGKRVVMNAFNTMTYNSGAKKWEEKPFLKNAPKELTEDADAVYAMNVDPTNGDIYIATSDYISTGNVYRFNASGTFIEKFDCGGIGPNKFIFL